MTDEMDDLTDGELKLLNDIEAIIDQGNNRKLEDDPMVRFCSLLASTQPQASQAFQQKLWKDLAAQKAPRKQFLARISRLPQHLRGLIIPVPRQRKSALLILAITLVIVIITSAFIPPVRAFTSELIKGIRLGNYVEVSQVESETPGATATTTIEPPLNLWLIKTGVMNYGGNLPVGVDPTVRIFSTIEEAQAQVSYRILQPKYLPDGYGLHEIKVPPQYPGSPVSVFLFYSGPGKDICFSLSPAGEGSVVTNSSKSISLTEQQVTVSQQVTVVQIVTDGSLEETRVNDHAAAWIEGDNLAWYVDGFLYTVGGLDLTEVEAIKIAESIQ